MFPSSDRRWPVSWHISCLDEQPMRVDEGPGLGHDAHARDPGEHAAEEGGAAARGHVDEGHLAVGGVAHLVGEAVEGRERHDDELLRREEVDDEDERGGLEGMGAITTDSNVATHNDMSKFQNLYRVTTDGTL